jgi:hypothetical protein
LQVNIPGFKRKGTYKGLPRDDSSSNHLLSALLVLYVFTGALYSFQVVAAGEVLM